MVANVVKASELFREKVVARYYSVTADLQRIDPAIDVSDSVSTTGSGFVPRSSHDTALTAFAQLGVLRLGASRALISLFDARYQYVLAEATQSLSLQCDTTHRQGDRLWLGEVVLPRKDDGICNVMLDQVLHTERSKFPDATSNVVIIDDLQQIAPYAACSWVVSGPKMRLAIGVPLVTSDGTIVGMFSIFDDKLHPEVAPEQKAFVSDMSKTIMAHLDAVRIQAEYKRRDKLINGLGSFLEGLSELRTSLDGKDESKILKAGKIAQGDADVDEKAAAREDVASAPPASQYSVATNESSSSLWESALPSGSKSMFSRASRIIRQAGDYDGVAFFYVSSNPQSQRKMRRDFLPTRDGRRSSPRHQSSSSSQNSSDGPSDDQKSQTGSATDASMTDDPDTSNLPCSLLAYALSDSERRTQSANASLFANFTQQHLERVFGAKPKGRVFILNDQAQVVAGDTSNTDSGIESALSPADEAPKSGEDTKTSKPVRNKNTRRVRSLLRLNPAARSFTVLPLWDHERHRWFSYCICWSASPRDPTLDGGLSYLRIFSDCITTALSHIDALSVSQAKTSFVASVSHELRSPLHGILGANNFLSDTHLTRFQEEMVESITSCGRTLLDTLEHVMDFSKINSFNAGKDSRKARERFSPSVGRRRKSVSEARRSMMSPVNLALLIEEVAEAVVMGFAVQHEFLYSDEKGSDDLLKTSYFDSALQNNVSGQTVLPQRIRVRIALALPAQQNAWLETEPGAWRRIMMNLFANALKYTSDGLIIVRLDTKEDPENRGSVRFVLTVKDTGRGISNDFLQNHLFRPFSQEDPFASGTGLGMSIVSQVVESLNGTVDAISSKGIGTTVKVDVSMLQIDPPLISRQKPDVISTVVEQLRGHRICLLEDTASRASVELNSIQRTSESSYSQILLQLLQDWFRVEASIQDSWIPGCADIVICLEPSFKHLANIRKAASSSHSAPPVLFIAYDALELAALRADARILSGESVVEVIFQPVGPRKLAKSLSQCVTRGEQEKDSGSQQRPILPSRTRSRAKDVSSPLLSPGEPWDGQSDRVLICDDNPVNLRLLGAFLRRQKTFYQEATNGKEAVDQYVAANGNFAFVFMDISMPIMDGNTASRMIRDYEKKNSLKRRTIIALTGLASAAARSEAEEAGIDEYLTKPINFQQLQDILQKCSIEESSVLQKAVVKLSSFSLSQPTMNPTTSSIKEVYETGQNDT